MTVTKAAPTTSAERLEFLKDESRAIDGELEALRLKRGETLLTGTSTSKIDAQISEAQKRLADNVDRASALERKIPSEQRDELERRLHDAERSELAALESKESALTRLRAAEIELDAADLNYRKADVEHGAKWSALAGARERIETHRENHPDLYLGEKL